MLFEVTHTTDYTYAEQVFFEPHTFRFIPKTGAHATLQHFDIEITPTPAGMSQQSDTEDNHNFHCWFDGMHDQMKITTHFRILAQDYNPFDFLIYPASYLKLPFEYDNRTQQLLKPSMFADEMQQETQEFYLEILKRADHQSINFLTMLTREIHQHFSLRTREKGQPYDPDHTFEKKAGSCRDLAWMQIQMLRSLGMAARFVSGYFYVDSDNPEFELHAWVEVYVPGAGWIGLDPGHGMLTNAYHIPVASSAYHEHTMPVSGSIRGTASSKLKNKLHIELSK